MYLVVFIGLSVACPNFLKFSDITIGIRQVVYTTIMAFATTLVISLDRIDLPAGPTVGISGVVLAVMILGGYSIYLATSVVTLLGAFIGLVSGLLMTRLRIAYFTAALGVMSILWGLIYVYTKGVPLYGLRYPEIQLIGQEYIGVVPFPIILILIILLMRYYLFYKTKFRRYTVSIGSNEDAVKLVGTNMNKIKIFVFMLSGVLCAIVGVILVSRSEVAIPGAGNTYEMDTITAIVIGGASMSGGKGNTVGTASGAIPVATTKNGLSLLNVNTFWHQVITGTLILFTVALDGYASNRVARNG